MPDPENRPDDHRPDPDRKPRRTARKGRSARSETYGTGSVYYDEKRESWAFQPKAEKGKRFPRQYYPTEPAARLARTDWLANQRAGIDPVAAEMTVTEWFRFWHEHYIAPDAAPSYKERHRQIIETYIVPSLGDLKLRAVQDHHILKWKALIVANLAPTSARNFFNLLKRGFEKAVSTRRLMYNPVLAVDPPKMPTRKQMAEKRVAFSPKQIKAILDYVNPSRFGLIYEIAVTYGLREGEVLGLLIAEIDLNAAIPTLRITGQVQSIRESYGAPRTTRRHNRTKTPDSKRTVPITPRLAAKIRAQLTYLRDMRQRKGPAWKEHGLLFPTTNGTPIAPRNLLRDWYDVLTQVGIIESVDPPRAADGQSGPKPWKRVQTGIPIPFHSLRHTALTNLNRNAPRHIVAAIAGHSANDPVDPSALDGYLHETIEEMLDALLAVEKYLDREWAKLEKSA